ncbi:hypothetical protein [Nocardia sp. NBC_01388]|uniref:hypothetical protein n=1 Tax=Nocardia sp. NBC_01388 TaxID=2903596 RepID=UPI003247BE6B
MYVEDVTLTGPISVELAEELAQLTSCHTSHIILTCKERRLFVGMLPLCLDDLELCAGDTITVTVSGGYRPPDMEDRQALRETVDLLAKAGAA